MWDSPYIWFVWWEQPCLRIRCEKCMDSWNITRPEESCIASRQRQGVGVAGEGEWEEKDNVSSVRCECGVLCDNFSWEDAIHIYSLQIGNPQQTKTQTAPKSSLVNQWALLRLFAVTWVRVITGAEMTQRQVRHQSPPQQGCQLTKLRTCSTLQPVDSSAGWRVPCAGASVGPNLLKTALLVLAFFPRWSQESSLQ